MLPSRGTLTSWRNWLKEHHGIQQGEMQSPGPRAEQPQCTNIFLGATQLESSSVKKSLEALVDIKLNTSWQYVLHAKKVSGVLGCIRRWKQVEGVDPSPLLSTGESKPGVLCPLLGFLVKVGHKHTGESPMKGCENRRIIELFGLEGTLRSCISNSPAIDRGAFH